MPSALLSTSTHAARQDAHSVLCPEESHWWASLATATHLPDTVPFPQQHKMTGLSPYWPSTEASTEQAGGPLQEPERGWCNSPGGRGRLTPLRFLRSVPVAARYASGGIAPYTTDTPTPAFSHTFPPCTSNPPGLRIRSRNPPEHCQFQTRPADGCQHHMHRSPTGKAAFLRTICPIRLNQCLINLSGFEGLR